MKPKLSREELVDLAMKEVVCKKEVHGSEKEI